MLIPDHETAVDFLNYEAIAKTVIALLKDNRQNALTIGIHGDWGAGKSSVLTMVLRQGLTLVVVGLAVGLGASVAAGKVLQSLLFHTAPTDPLTLAAVAFALALAGTLACLGPAWRATGVDPILALRAD